MPSGAVQYITDLRRPERARRIASTLWIAWAIIVWNVVFDRVIVVAGRRYLEAAALAAAAGSYARMDDWMRPAVARALWSATSAAAAILVVGLLAIRYAPRPTP